MYTVDSRGLLNIQVRHVVNTLCEAVRKIPYRSPECDTCRPHCEAAVHLQMDDWQAVVFPQKSVNQWTWLIKH